MNFKQQGVTLIEVLVGFVIFMASLVVVLDYVSEQIFHSHRSADNLEQLQFIYQLESMRPYFSDRLDMPNFNQANMRWSMSESVLETFKQRKKDLALKKITYQLGDGEKNFQWEVLSID